MTENFRVLSRIEYVLSYSIAPTYYWSTHPCVIITPNGRTNLELGPRLCLCDNER